MKAVVSNRIYLTAEGDFLRELQEATTHRIEKVISSGRGKPKKAIEVIKNYTMLRKDVISIPRGRMDLIPEDYEIVDKRVDISVPFPTPRISLRDDQIEIANAVDSDCFINALPGWGKTFTALHIAQMLGQRTIVVTHNTMLLSHWIKEAETLFDMPIGIITAGTFDIDEHALVVGNVQTLTKYSNKIGKEFGCMIIDEAHHAPAETFTQLIDQSYAKYRVGLSGTMIRKDGRHILFDDYFSSRVFRPKQANTVNPVIRLLKTGVQLTPGEQWVRKINNLLYDKDYQNFVAVIAASRIAAGHKVLIMADRIEFLTNVQKLLGDTCVLVVGDTNTEARESVKNLINSGEKRAIAGSRSIFSEGISINSLSSVILATPIANEASLEQIIGRVMRVHPDKPVPEVIDLQFAGYADKKQNNLRLGFYLKKGWDVVAY